jgi:hypothetical protein
MDHARDGDAGRMPVGPIEAAGPLRPYDPGERALDRRGTLPASARIATQTATLVGVAGADGSPFSAHHASKLAKSARYALRVELARASAA